MAVLLLAGGLFWSAPPAVRAAGDGSTASGAGAATAGRMAPTPGQSTAGATTGSAATGDMGQAAGSQSGPQAATAGTRMQIPSPILTLDQDRLFRQSLFGQRVAREYEAGARALAAQNRRIEAQLSSEEKSLTERRAKLSPEEFRKLADAFDAKVQRIRKAQAEKNTALDRRRTEARQRFMQIVVPVLGDLVRQLGAVAILNANAVFLSFKAIDVTDRAIAEVNARIGDGAKLSPPAAGGDGGLNSGLSGTAVDGGGGTVNRDGVGAGAGAGAGNPNGGDTGVAGSPGGDAAGGPGGSGPGTAPPLSLPAPSGGDNPPTPGFPAGTGH